MIRLHTICSLLSYAAFLVACVVGALFLLQERQLKRKRMGWLFHRLPALSTLDRINLRAVGIGFALLSMAVVFGIAGSHQLFGSWWSWSDPTTVLTVILWASYCLLWVTRLRATLRGRKVALLSMLGFTLALFTWLGVSRWLPTWHRPLS